MPKHIIELDCPPGEPRPGDLLPQIIKGTLLEGRPELSESATTIRLFGHWAWEYEISEESYAQVSPILAARIKALYAQNIIRAGSW